MAEAAEPDQYPIQDEAQPDVDMPQQPPQAQQEPPQAQQEPPQQPAGPPGELENLRREVQTLQKTLENFTKASVENILHRLMNYIARRLTEFNKYEALEMTEELQNAAHDRKHQKERYYRIVYQTIREKMGVPPLQFRALLLRFLGDKDQEKVSDIVSKVDKQFTRQRSQDNRSVPTYSSGDRGLAPWTNARCFYCNKIGHFQSHCTQRRRNRQATESPAQIEKMKITQEQSK